jgi:branched-chain amino acid transport system ATP-binding protein
MSSVLQVDGLTKRFGALAAVNDLTFEVKEGETYGIAGPNGAGKTTLFDLVTGHARATAGRVLLRGEEIQTLPAHAITQRGVGRTFQIPIAFQSQTLLGTVVAAAYFGGSRRRFSGLGFDAESLSRARSAIRFVDLEEREADRADSLSVFDRKRATIAAALATQPFVLLLDEPVAGLSENEAERIVALIERVKAEGMTVVLIEHVISVLMKLSDRVLVMNQGEKLFEGTPEEVSEDPEVNRVYFGRLEVTDAVALE